MSVADYSGYWTGSISGTNQGGFTLDVRQDGEKISGVAKIAEPSLGQYEYLLQGTVTDVLSVRMVPTRQSSGAFQLGNVQVICSMDAAGLLTGRWKSDIGTEGVLSAKRFESKPLTPDLPKTNSVFLVHGHDEGAKHAVARFLEQIGVVPVILQEQINRGMTVIEKFEEFAARAGFAVVLMTPDDFGYPAGKEEEKKARPRQNVILELGYFSARLGRDKTLVLTKGDIEMPSDVLGLVYEAMDRSDGWKMRLAAELKAAGFSIDLNRALG
jgi:predicted nucleotide-binding protein